MANAWVLPTDFDLLQRFIDKIEFSPSSGCWLWTAAKGDGGYAHFKVDGKQRNAHKYCYELLVGPVPGDLQLDHLCRIRHCVNPFHLEPVTGRVNTLRGTGPTALAAVKTHCTRGHEFTVENTRISKGKRHCRKCYAERSRLHYQRKKGASNA